MNFQKYFGTLFVLSFGGLILGLAWIQRPSVCTNSKVVDKIDIVDGKTAGVSVPRCRLADSSVFSQDLNDLTQNIDSMLLPLERFLENIRPFRYRVTLQINNEKPLFFKVANKQIEIGTKLIETSALQRGLIKNWLLQSGADYLSENQLVLETLTDIYLFSYQGDLSGHNILTSQLQNVSDVPRWPLSLANLETYCRGAWVIPEHLQTCSQKIKDFTLSKDSEVVDWSLRPLLAKIWTSTLKSLSLNERKVLLEKWSTIPIQIINADAFFETAALEKTFPSTIYEELVSTNQNTIRTLSKWVMPANLDVTNKQKSTRRFLETVQQQTAVMGFQDYKNLPRFDFVLKIDIPITGEDPRLVEMKKLSEQNPHMNLAVHAGKQMWLLPSMTAVSDNTFPKIYTHRMIYESCHMKFGSLLGLNDTTEKILLVRNCHDSSPKKYTSFMNDGVSGFALQNPKVEFVHLHLPSLSLRKKFLNSESDVYSTISKRDLRDPLFQVFGWESLNWVDRYKAYHPKAQIEAIEWFRLF